MGTAPTSTKVTEQVSSPRELEAIARMLYEGFNERDLDRVAAIVADDGEWVDIPSGTLFRGPSGFVDFDKSWIKAFSNARIEIVNMVASGDLVVTEFIGRGTHDGPLIAASGKTVEATGKTVELRCIDLVQMKAGKVVRGRTYYDALSLLGQLGVTKS